jgi:hypothetical protein
MKKTPRNAKNPTENRGATRDPVNPWTRFSIGFFAFKGHFYSSFFRDGCAILLNVHLDTEVGAYR